MFSLRSAKSSIRICDAIYGCLPTVGYFWLWLIIDNTYNKEKGKRMKKLLCVVCMLCLSFLFSCKVSDVKKPLEGKWQVLEAQVNGPEKYLSDEMEFFSDGTVSMSDLPDKRLKFKTELTKEENELLRKNYPALVGKNVLMIMLDQSGQNWLQQAVVYQFTVSDNELTLRPVIAEKPVKFRKVKSGGHK